MCQNGGSCTDLVDGYRCLCAEGYTGTNCQTGETDFNKTITYNYNYKAFISRHSSGLKTCSEALTRHSVDKRKHKNK